LKNIIARLPEHLLPAKRRPKSAAQQRKTAKSSKGGFPPLDAHSEPEEGEYQGTDPATAAGSASTEAPLSAVDPETKGMVNIGKRLEGVRSVIAERIQKSPYSLYKPDLQAARERGKRARSPTVKVRRKRVTRARSSQTRPDTELDVKSTPTVAQAVTSPVPSGPGDEVVRGQSTEEMAASPEVPLCGGTGICSCCLLLNHC
jgi:hypothetical protein